MFMVLLRSSHGSGKPKNDNIKINSNSDSKTKIMIVGNSLVKYLRREELTSKKNNVKVITHDGSTTEDMLDYIKPIARRKPDTLILHTGTNDLTNGVNTMKKVRKLGKVVRDESSDDLTNLKKLRSVFPVLFTVKIKTFRMNQQR